MYAYVANEFMTKELRLYDGKITIFSKMCTGKIKKPHGKE